MKNKVSILLVLIFLIIPLLVYIIPKISKESFQEELPWLHVEKNKLLDENGQEIILRGVAIEDPGYTIGRGLKERDFAEPAHNWKVNVIRIPIHPDLWQQNPSYTKDYLDKIVLFGRQYQVYILFGWHAHGNPLTGEVEPVEFQYPYKGNPYNPDLDLAMRFWKETAKPLQKQLRSNIQHF